MIVYETDKYTVETEEEEGAYLLRSKKTGIVEYAAAALPKVLLVADEYTKALVDRDKLKPRSSNDNPIVTFVSNTPK